MRQPHHKLPLRHPRLHQRYQIRILLLKFFPTCIGRDGAQRSTTTRFVRLEVALLRAGHRQALGHQRAFSRAVSQRDLAETKQPPYEGQKVLLIARAHICSVPHQPQHKICKRALHDSRNRCGIRCIADTAPNSAYPMSVVQASGNARCDRHVQRRTCHHPYYSPERWTHSELGRGLGWRTQTVVDREKRSMLLRT